MSLYCNVKRLPEGFAQRKALQRSITERQSRRDRDLFICCGGPCYKGVPTYSQLQAPVDTA